MKKVFIGGSRRISRLNAAIQQRLDQIIERNLRVLIGDANGADKAVQSYLHQRQYKNVTVFCSSAPCRNNISSWTIESVTPDNKVKDFAFYTAKDAEMARRADAALMLWDGQSAGTMVNVARLISAGKTTVVYFAPEGTLTTVKNTPDLATLLSQRPQVVRRRIMRYITEHAPEYLQSNLFETRSDELMHEGSEKRDE